MPSTNSIRRLEGVLPAIPTQKVNNFIPVSKYYRSAGYLIKQANEYRVQKNDLQLYTMLMRLASLMIETIPKHKDFKKSDPEYVKFKRELITVLFPEMEGLKVRLRLNNGAESSLWMEQPKSHTPNTVQLSTSNFPQMNWGLLASQPSVDAATSGRPQDFGMPPVSTSADLLSGTYPGESYSFGQDTSTDSLPTFQTNLRTASQGTRDRHALLPAMAPASRHRQAAGGPLYPSFDTSPYCPIDYGHDRSQGGQAPLEQQVVNLKMADFPLAGPGSLMDADALPRPTYGLTPGPQELEVQQLAAPLGGMSPDVAYSCCEAPPPPPPPPPPPEEQPGSISKQKEIREVHVSMALMEEFLAYARSNTRRGIESCGILSGVLDTKRGLFSITTLIVPKQEGTSDTVQALAEEEIFEAQDSRNLYPMGWIHTHPTQTCFLSSIDVHTQCGYQTMLDEAVAIVMAPSDRAKRCGIFRLSTPGGLKLVQKCQSRGFHTHQTPETGQPIYELCGHVYLSESLKHSVVDLR